MAKNKKETVKKNEIVETHHVEQVIVYPQTDSFLKNHWWKVLVLCLIGIAIYIQTYKFGYVLDDLIVVQENNFTKKGFGGIYDLLTNESMTGYFGEQKNLVEGNRYRPLSLITLAMEYGVFNKLNPGFSHIVNILLYLLSCIIIMRAVQLLIPQKEKLWGIFDFGFLVALLFLVHPIHVEAVANIKGRDEVMAMLFSMTALYFFTKHYLYGQGKVQLYLGLLTYFLGLLSKENTITFLAVIPLSIYFFGDKVSSKTWNAFFWLLLITLFYLVFRFSISGVPKLSTKITDIMNNPFVGMSGGEKIATIFYTLGLYIKLLFIPYPLTHDYYPYAIPIMNFGKWQTLLSMVLYFGLAYIGIKSLRNKNIGGYSILFYLITLTIVSNFVVSIGTFMNDRFIYMPSLGFCILFIWAIFHYGDKIKALSSDITKSVFSFVPIVLFAILSFIRVPDWATAMTLNKSALKISQNSARANSFMSTALFEEQKNLQDPKQKLALLNEALPYAKKAIEILPDYYNANLMAAGIAGEMHKLDHDDDKLYKVFEPCIINRPNVEFIAQYLKYINPSVQDREKLINFYIKVSNALIKKNDIESIKWGIQYLKIGLEADPTNATISNMISRAFNTLGDTEQARQYAR